MEFKNQKRNTLGKCDVPEQTTQRIHDGFSRLNLDVGYAPYQVSENIFWGQIWIDKIQMVCNGKGVTPEMAKASAYAELAERFSAGLFYPAFEERVRHNIPALYGRKARGFLNFEWMDGYVNARPADINSDVLTIEALLKKQAHLVESDIRHIKESPMARHWVDGYSLMQEKTVKVPISFVNYISASNGLAAGNTIEEALVQASCEIFERHAQIDIIKSETVVPTFDPDTVTHSEIQKMIRFYKDKNVDVFLKDLSLGGLLPCVGVLFVNHNLAPGRLEHKILIPGVSFDLDEALCRCFTESMQGRQTLAVPRPELNKPIVHRSRVDNYYLLMKCCISPKDISFLEQGVVTAYTPARASDVGAEISSIKKISAKLDTDCILVNFTHPILDFPVVRVIMPGVSDFLSFLSPDILIAHATRPPATEKGERFVAVMQSFFPA